MSNTKALVLCLLTACVWTRPAPAQSARGEFWPEFGVYIQQGQVIRFEFVDLATSNSITHDWLGNFTVYVDAALRNLSSVTHCGTSEMCIGTGTSPFAPGIGSRTRVHPVSPSLKIVEFWR